MSPGDSILLPRPWDRALQASYGCLGTGLCHTSRSPAAGRWCAVPTGATKWNVDATAEARMVNARTAGAVTSDPFAVLPASARARLRPAAVPDWTSPMLATLTDQRFSDPGWIFERKLDGERCLAFARAGRVTL